MLFNTTCHSLGRSRESSADLTNKEEAPNKGALGAPLRSGFTLIELLVVVLIIGILAAVAVPQYQKAVYRARMAEALAVLPGLSNAHVAYGLATGETTNDLSKLDIEVPRGSSSWIASNADDPNHYYFSCASSENMGHCAANAANPDLPLLTWPDKHCIKWYGKSAVAERLCKAIGTYNKSASDSNGGRPYYTIRY